MGLEAILDGLKSQVLFWFHSPGFLVNMHVLWNILVAARFYDLSRDSVQINLILFISFFQLLKSLLSFLLWWWGLPSQAFVEPMNPFIGLTQFWWLCIAPVLAFSSSPGKFAYSWVQSSDWVLLRLQWYPLFPGSMSYWMQWDLLLRRHARKVSFFLLITCPIQSILLRQDHKKQEVILNSSPQISAPQEVSQFPLLSHQSGICLFSSFRLRLFKLEVTWSCEATNFQMKEFVLWVAPKNWDEKHPKIRQKTCELWMNNTYIYISLFY